MSADAGYADRWNGRPADVGRVARRHGPAITPDGAKHPLWQSASVAVLAFAATLLIPAIAPLWIFFGVLVTFGAVMAAREPRRRRASPPSR
jgi:hypothetical protein